MSAHLTTSSLLSLVALISAAPIANLDAHSSLKEEAALLSEMILPERQVMMSNSAQTLNEPHEQVIGRGEPPLDDARRTPRWHPR